MEAIYPVSKIESLIEDLDLGSGALKDWLEKDQKQKSSWWKNPLEMMGMWTGSLLAWSYLFCIEQQSRVRGEQLAACVEMP